MDPVLEVEGLVTRFGAERIHDGVSFRVRRGEMVALIGASGTGKSVLLKEVIGLVRPSAGTIRLFGVDVWRASPSEMNALRCGGASECFSRTARFSPRSPWRRTSPCRSARTPTCRRAW
jgi:ABC-type transporter Mla maintaining outer membrane lipid asymmetry ATPase subunit MlaF